MKPLLRSCYEIYWNVRGVRCQALKIPPTVEVVPDQVWPRAPYVSLYFEFIHKPKGS